MKNSMYQEPTFGNVFMAVETEITASNCMRSSRLVAITLALIGININRHTVLIAKHRCDSIKYLY